ncbi:TlpA family protein disulfide reductase [Flavivirga jejuensis]|uniref:TlpA disulfide reductase family protein n=1 Tax=Flavivirga jejuensis TaxID=870487 RepID=A0ABT8WNN2_9FLAO|nr:TlpA disulfide reductase family protein [Flavivirga jejuensis]MDO5974767.1 TlpA disulfide reductase family protein [Flavivirga jejuensis]
MKLEKIVIVIFIIGLIGCSKKNHEIIITGKTIGNIPDKIEYTVPINGTWFYGAKKSVVPDSLGDFTISLKSDSASFVTLFVPKQTATVLLVEPDKKYEIDFHLNSKENKIKGESNEAQTLYKSFAFPDFHVLSSSNELLKDSVFTTISSKINTLKEKEIFQFREQLEKKSITKAFYDLAELDRKHYYAALETSISKVKYNGNFDSSETQNAQIIKLWKKTFHQTPPTESFDIRSPWSFVLINNYIEVNQFNFGTLDLEGMKKIFKQRQNHSFNVKEAKKYLKGQVLEFYLANYILSNSFRNKENSKELIDLYDEFKIEYPNSNYSEYLTSFIKPIIDFHKKIEKSMTNEKIKFIENYKNIDTFDELTKNLKGKKVFIDIWGTWCAPCKEEFQHKDKLNKLLKSKNIEVLYICEGKNSKEKVWKEMIKFYNLEGSHIRANNKLLTDIIKKLERVGSFYYPYYILIDENGEIVKNPAKKPSQLSELEKEISENYVW